MVLGGGVFLCYAAFMEADKLNEHTGIIIGFVTGSFIANAIRFYFGGQNRQKETEPKKRLSILS